MNILFSITYYHPYVSGLTLYCKRLAEALSQREHNVTVVCMQHEDRLKEKEVIRGVTVVRAKPFLRLSKGFLSFRWFTHSWRLVQEADVLFVNLPQMEGCITAFLAKLCGKRVISIYHCEIDLPKGFINDCIQTFLEIANTISLALSDGVITYTRDYAASSRILRPFLKKTKYIFPPVPVPIVKKNIQKVLKKKIGEADRVIGVAARLAEEKGVEYLLEAMKQIKERVRLVIAGPSDPIGEGAYKRRICNLIKKLKSNVVFLGSLKQEEMGAFYSLLDVLVLPSVNSTEAFGMVQVEAMLCGVPVVASDLPGVRIPIQKTGMGIIVPPRNKNKLASAISTILKDKTHYIRPKKTIEKTFSLKKTIDFYETFI